MTMFSTIDVYDLTLKPLLITAAQSLTVAGIVFFSVSKDKIEKLLGQEGLTRYGWLMASGLLIDMIFVIIKVIYF